VVLTLEALHVLMIVAYQGQYLATSNKVRICMTQIGSECGWWESTPVGVGRRWGQCFWRMCWKL